MANKDQILGKVLHNKKTRAILTERGDLSCNWKPAQDG